jgi:hypothetical protein
MCLLYTPADTPRLLRLAAGCVMQVRGSVEDGISYLLRMREQVRGEGGWGKGRRRERGP